MYCGKCGKEIEVTERFCSYCGAPNGSYKEELDMNELVQGIKAKKENVIEAFYKMTYRQGFAVAIQIVKNEQDAMDLLQDAYVSALTKIDQLDNPARLKSWFNCIVANRCRDWLKKSKAQLFTDMEKEDDSDGVEERISNKDIQFSPEDSVDYSETKRLMQNILNQLPEDQKLCILMYYYEELSISEIADALDCSAGTVKSRLNYARKKIKNEVEELEKQGTKLYSIAPIPFIVWMLASEEKAIEVKASGLKKWKEISAAQSQMVENIDEKLERMAERQANKYKANREWSLKEQANYANAEAIGGKVAKSGIKHLFIKTIAGITAAAVVGAGAYVGYKKYTEKNPTYSTTKKINKTDKKKEEKIAEFTLTQKQKEQIQLAAGLFYRAEMENTSISQGDDFKISIVNNKVPIEILHDVAQAIAFKDESIKSKNVEIEETNDIKLLMLKECQKFLQDTFKYKTESWDDVSDIFDPAINAGTDVFKAKFIERAANSYSSEDFCKVNRFVQTGKNEYHFYAKIRDAYTNDESVYAGVMDITAHRDEKSKIGGFVFDNISYSSGKEDIVAESIERTVANLPIARGESEHSGNPEGTYEIDKLSNKEFITYANIFMTYTEEIAKEELVDDEGVGDGERMSIKSYKDICTNTLGRRKKYKINGVPGVDGLKNEIIGNKVKYYGRYYEVLYLTQELKSVESVDGTVKCEGTLIDYSDNIHQKYAFKAEGKKDKKSKTGVVINKVEISKKN